MKRCPECGRNYNDDSMSFCLDDGAELLFGPASMDEPATAILSGEDKTRTFRKDDDEKNKEKPAFAEISTRRWARWLVVFITLSATAFAAFMIGRTSRVPDAGSSLRSASISISSPLALGKYAPSAVGRTAVALSPNGTTLVYVGEHEGKSRLVARPLDSFNERPLPGTEGAYAPFFSPDSRSVAFFADNKLQRVSLDSGQPVTLCEARNAYGGAWGPDDTIVFIDSEGLNLVRISASSGESLPAIQQEGLPATIWGFSSPEILPDGDTVLVTLWESPNPDKYKIAAFSLRSGAPRILVEGGVSPRYLPSGHLVYGRSSTLIAVPFDVRTLSITGPEITLVENVRSEEWGAVQYSIAQDGTLIFVAGGPAWIARLVWADRKGSITPLNAPARAYKNIQISPDGRSIAVEIADATQDIYIYDLDRGGLTRFTNNGNNGYPRWTPDGTALTFSRHTARGLEIVSKSISSGAEQVLVTRNTGDLQSVSPDGKHILFLQVSPESGLDQWMLSEGEPPRPWLSTPFSEILPTFSPNGQYVAYVSDESGQYEIYIRPFSGESARRQVSTGGGDDPVWSKDGRELFYRNGQKLMAVNVSTSPQLKAGTPELLFEGPFLNIAGTSFDVSADGRFLLIEEYFKQPPTTQIQVVFNWSNEVKRRVGAGNS